MNRTKIVGVCMVVTAVAATVKDVFDGGGFNLSGHFNELKLAFEGLGLYFLRDALQKLTSAGIKL